MSCSEKSHSLGGSRKLQLIRVSLQSLNSHYVTISTVDRNHEEPLSKQTVPVCPDQQQCITEYSVVCVLDKLRPTATGLDNIPSWFQRLTAPFLSKPIADLFNLALTTSTVPTQWKQACIRPIQKVSAPKQHADNRPISITVVLTRVMERLAVRQYSICTMHYCRPHLLCSLPTSLPSILPALLLLP